MFVGFTLAVGLCFACGTPNNKLESVSLMQLIADPDKFHGKLVRVIGVSRIEFEGDFKIQIVGPVTAHGTEEKPIVFTGCATSFL